MAALTLPDRSHSTEGTKFMGAFSRLFNVDHIVAMPVEYRSLDFKGPRSNVVYNNAVTILINLETSKS